MKNPYHDRNHAKTVTVTKPGRDEHAYACNLSDIRKGITNGFCC